MNKERVSLVIACFMGAFIGALISLECARWFLYGEYFWILGALAGGCVAYVIVDFERVVQAIKTSFKEMRSELAVWSTDWEMMWASLVYWAGVACIMACATMYTIVLGAGFALAMSGDIDFDRIKPLVVLVVGISLYFSIENRWYAFGLRERDRKTLIADMHTDGLDFMRYGNPFSIGFITLVCLYEILVWSINHVPHLFRAIVRCVIRVCSLPILFIRFAVRIFVLVHSQRRIICFVDATLGATVGFFLGSAIIGGICGAFFGLVNYEIVTKRILKLET